MNTYNWSRLRVFVSRKGEGPPGGRLFEYNKSNTLLTLIRHGISPRFDLFFVRDWWSFFRDSSAARRTQRRSWVSRWRRRLCGTAWSWLGQTRWWRHAQTDFFVVGQILFWRLLDVALDNDDVGLFRRRTMFSDDFFVFIRFPTQNPYQTIQLAFGCLLFYWFNFF